MNEGELKTDLKNIPCKNTLSQNNLPASKNFDLFYEQISTLFDQRVSLHKLFEKKKILKQNHAFKANSILMKKLSQLCCNECDPTLKPTKPNNIKIVRNSVIFKLKKSDKPCYVYGKS